MKRFERWILVTAAAAVLGLAGGARAASAPAAPGAQGSPAPQLFPSSERAQAPVAAATPAPLRPSWYAAYVPSVQPEPGSAPITPAPLEPSWFGRP